MHMCATHGYGSETRPPRRAAAALRGEFRILLSLAGERHGSGIIQDIGERDELLSRHGDRAAPTKNLVENPGWSFR
jgi:hypothetical protein